MSATTPGSMLHVACPESQSQTWVPEALLVGLPADVSAGDVISDDDLDLLHHAVATRLAAGGSEDDIWFLRQVLAVVDDAIEEKSVVLVRLESSDHGDGPIRPGEAATLNSNAIKERLHDAWIDFESLVSDGESTKMHGYVQRYRRRFDYNLTVEPSGGFQLDDQAQIGGTSLGDVHYDGNAIVFVGHMPSTLTVLAAEDVARVRVESHPFALRRWFRWRDLPTP
jgi:hypothetical protein